MIWEIDENTQTIEGLDADGRPDPAYAAALGMLRAPFGRRALAATIDAAAWLLLQLPLWLGAVPLLLKLLLGSISPYGFLNHPDFVLAVVMAGITTLLTLVLLVVQLVLHGRKGTTIGKAITGIRTVNVRTLERPGVGAVLLRFLIVGAAGVVPLFGSALMLISPTFDPEGRGRGLHDKATKVWLVDARKGLNPYDEKRMRVARKIVKTDPTPERSALPSLATPVDPAAQPQYRPGSRVSAGVLGVARPYEAHERPAIGLLQTSASAQPSPVEAGKPVLGGYRVADGERPAGVEQRPVEPDARVEASSRRELRQAQPVSQAQPVPQAAPVAQAAPAAPAVPQAAPATPAVPQAAASPAHAVPPAAAVPAAPMTPAVLAAQAAATQFALRFDTGDRIPITGPVLLGRNPDAGEHPGAHAVALADDSRSLSKTHLLVRPVDGGLEIVDCHSTNGSGLIRGGTEYGVAAGVPVQAADGDMIRLGDRVAAVVRA